MEWWFLNYPHDIKSCDNFFSCFLVFRSFRLKFLEHLPILTIVIPIISTVVIPIVGRVNRLACWIIACVVTFFSFLSAIYLLITVQTSGNISYRLGGWEPPWGIEYAIDSLNGFVLAVVSFIAFVVCFYSRKSVDFEIAKAKNPAFYSIFMLFVTGVMGMVITGDIFNLYVFLEITSIAGYTLIASGKNRGALMASYNYLIFGTIAGTFILIGIGHIYMETGTLNIADLRERLSGSYHSTVVLTAFAFFTVGFCLKIALYPLHVWLPKAYGYAPSVVSALMAAVGTKVGVYAMLRVMFGVFRIEFDMEVVPVTKILLVVSSVAIIVGSVLALAQTRIKWMLAYSSIGQMGYIILGSALTNHTAMTGSIIHIMNHALMKGSLFMVVGCLVYKIGLEDVSEFKGLGRKMPFTMAAFTVSALSMMGVPLTVGFVSKWHIAIGALDAGMWYFVPVLLVSSLLTTAYFWRIIEMIYFHNETGSLLDTRHRRQEVDSVWYSGDSDSGALKEKRAESKRPEAPWSMLAPTLAVSIMCIVFGIASKYPISIAEKAASILLERSWLDIIQR